MKLKKLNPYERLMSFVVKDKLTECWNWTGAKKKFGYGYLMIGSRIDNTRKTVSAHRYAYTIFNQIDIPKNAWVLHTCDNPSCINPNHLYLGDRRQNTLDRENRGRNKIPGLSGENHPNAKLNWDIVEKIRSDYEVLKYKICLLSYVYEINRRTISDVVNYKTWKPEPPKED